MITPEKIIDQAKCIIDILIGLPWTMERSLMVDKLLIVTEGLENDRDPNNIF